LNSCKEFDGLPATLKNMERAKGCLRMALLYVDRTVNPPILRYLEPDDSYEVVGWKREDRKVFYIVRLKDGTVVQLDEIELRHLDVLLKIREKLTRL